VLVGLVRDRDDVAAPELELAVLLKMGRHGTVKSVQ
jgi:hypothetical protein